MTDPKPSVRDLHLALLAHWAAHPDTRGDDTTIVMKPGGDDWRTVKGRWDPTCTNYNPHAASASVDYAEMWEAWTDGLTGWDGST